MRTGRPLASVHLNLAVTLKIEFLHFLPPCIGRASAFRRFAAVERKGWRGTPRRRAVHVCRSLEAAGLGCEASRARRFSAAAIRISRAPCDARCGAPSTTKEAPARRPREWSHSIPQPLRAARIVGPRAHKRRSNPRGRTIRTAPLGVGRMRCRKQNLTFKTRAEIDVINLSTGWLMTSRSEGRARMHACLAQDARQKFTHCVTDLLHIS